MDRQRIWQILEPAEGNDLASKVFDIFISIVIVVAITALVLESVQELANEYSHAFRIVEWTCLAVFIPEYFLRLWSCKASDKYSGRYGRLRWAFSFMALTDLAAILPSLFWFCGFDLRFLRAVRLMRLMRLAGYSRGMRIIARTFAECRGQLYVCLTGVVILLLIASSALYFVEREANPQAFSSIPAAMWWAVCTLSTVGYGDVYPITPLGKVLAAVIAVLGIGVFALPAGIIAGNIEKVWKGDLGKMRCPHCGRDI